jgi:hypothetical protein
MFLFTRCVQILSFNHLVLLHQNQVSRDDSMYNPEPGYFRNPWQLALIKYLDEGLVAFFFGHFPVQCEYLVVQLYPSYGHVG